MTEVFVAEDPCISSFPAARFVLGRLAFPGILMLWLLSLLVSASPSLASSYTLNLGPAALGRGGPNPLSIPPTFTDVGFIHVGGSAGNREISVSVSPGLFFWGYRLTGAGPGPYFSLGGGLVTSANGGALGIYSAFGWEAFCGASFCFNVDYRQALGITASPFLSPYALRIGLSYMY